MANTPQARKRVRQAVKARTRNAAQKSNFRSSIKKVLKSLAEKIKINPMLILKKLCL